VGSFFDTNIGQIEIICVYRIIFVTKCCGFLHFKCNVEYGFAPVDLNSWRCFVSYITAPVRYLLNCRYCE
jgi:hypothetical protein